MTKKKRSTESLSGSDKSSPFRKLKGFAVSGVEEPEAPPVSAPPEPQHAEAARSFADEMEFLGVKPLAGKTPPVQEEDPAVAIRTAVAPSAPTDEELFLASLGQMDVQFSDEFPAEAQLAVPRRLRQLRRGTLHVDAQLDLHGLLRPQVAEKLSHFLQNAVYHGWQTLLIVTGRGLHSAEGQPVLRDAAERYLAADEAKLIAEWGRAPRKLGGDGALVVFLKKQTTEHE